MKRNLNFRLPYRAIGKESVRGGRKFYTPKKSSDFMRKCRNVFAAAMGTPPLEGALMVEISCYFKRPEKLTIKDRWMIQKPDADNIEKALYDAGSKVVWKDDAQISVSITKKMWGEEDSIDVSVLEL